MLLSLSARRVAREPDALPFGDNSHGAPRSSELMRLPSMRSAFALAFLTGASFANATGPCLAPGEPIQWLADYCMLKMETDDEIAASGCMEQERKRVFPNSCASNTHFKQRMCEVMIQSGTEAGTLERCMNDPTFMGRTVRNGGVGD